MFLQRPYGAHNICIAIPAEVFSGTDIMWRPLPPPTPLPPALRQYSLVLYFFSAHMHLLHGNDERDRVKRFYTLALKLLAVKESW